MLYDKKVVKLDRCLRSHRIHTQIIFLQWILTEGQLHSSLGLSQRIRVLVRFASATLVRVRLLPFPPSVALYSNESNLESLTPQKAANGDT